ncbi:glycosyltransferase [Bacteroides sp. 214]|uniref:glycosyltransferase family 2 protein n=1 Tax=Bacteroides sp. 214 TaxID=2302935 RepID=UPI0013D715E7|nr:glycosyltransferase family 2 protein [Bacteroides sp. 214]NDW11790.1 glycosyltransferase [Bacteroides sp. 214]
MSSLITIVTVSYNAASTIEATILNVINQTYKNIEYIIIDGGSKDDTLDIIKRYEDKISSWISEPDKGVYDAMNKGIEKATGEWILFLNCGDSFYTNTVLFDVAERLGNSDADVVYGDTMCVFSEKINKRIDGLSIENIQKRMPFCHQSCFLRTKVAKENLFDLGYKVCADYNQFYNLYTKGARFEYVSTIIAYYNLADVSLSNSNELLMFDEIAKINGSDKHTVFKLKRAVFSFRVLLKRMCPSFIVNGFRNLKY